ncbi:2166_t:CDS:2 [Funneliformis caledonium]|uniref:2166_t:CDS:1 n=1 Tax=Funneliformis caledonium TaxID=1117310 RepID=A0A9N8VKB3_9GLOM|nr:2166_t:CDS:2 [Funneliformis caledonium]
MYKIGKAFSNEPVDEHVHLIIQHKYSVPSTSIVERINELEKTLKLMRSSLVVDNLQADMISTKFIRISDSEQVERWQIAYESSAALCFRDRYGEGDKRYAMFNNRSVNI